MWCNSFYQRYYKEEYEKEHAKFVDHKRIDIDQTLPPAVICDIDGTIAWMQGRYPYDLNKVQEDKVVLNKQEFDKVSVCD